MTRLLDLRTDPLYKSNLYAWSDFIRKTGCEYIYVDPPKYYVEVKIDLNPTGIGYHKYPEKYTHVLDFWLDISLLKIYDYNKNLFIHKVQNEEMANLTFWVDILDNKFLPSSKQKATERFRKFFNMRAFL